MRTLRYIFIALIFYGSYVSTRPTFKEKLQVDNPLPEAKIDTIKLPIDTSLNMLEPDSMYEKWDPNYQGYDPDYRNFTGDDEWDGFYEL